MEKEFAPYKLAVKLKALGFGEPCFGYYYTLNGKDWKFAERADYFRLDDEISIGGKFSLLAPTFSQAFRWFRDNHRMFHEVFIDTEPTVDEPDKLEFTYIVLHMVGMEEMHTSKNKRFNTYEEAELACLEKLIEIVETKSE
jgi:hypothetical protein